MVEEWLQRLAIGGGMKGGVSCGMEFNSMKWYGMECCGMELNGTDRNGT